MKVDCRWFSTNLEAYFCESLGDQELQLASEHLKTCLSCRSEVQALRDLDPMLKQLLEFRIAKAMAAAHAPARRIGFQLGLAGTAVALTGILVFVTFLRHPAGKNGLPSGSQTALQTSPSPEGGDDKVEGAPLVTRAKPDSPDPKSPAIKSGPEPSIPDNAPAFLVTDPSGYSKSLEDYRGRVLLIGVWSADQPEAAQNLQKLYQAFGNRKEVRILGATSRSTARLAGMTFPMVFNNGSRLLDTANSSYVIVDKEGVVQMRGSLVGDSTALTTKVKARLDELGGR